MNYSPISFPGLGIGPFAPDPVMFTVFGLSVRWYGVLMAFGFMLAVLYGTKYASWVGVKADHILDALLFCFPAGVIGARLYYVIFNWQEFSGNPMRVFSVREGGMAFYGSLLGALGVAAIFAGVRKISAKALFDLSVIGFLIGQCIGRWGNYFNREAYGAETELPWRMEIMGWDHGTYRAMQVHPTFLYESLWTGIGFFLLHFLLKRRKYDGQIVLYYMVWYGLGRGLIEGLRADSLYLFNTGVRVSQLLSFAFCAAGLGLLLLFRLKPPKRPMFKDAALETAAAAGAADAEEESGRPGAGHIKDKRVWRLKDKDEE
ncbi:MAG: prolipoprotein diacylglyceryl transferase [Oscillospiraceae bacterium]|nr:prolipoprotein diacylglyceryl transferase [Oscillospiraceae bacterium]